LKKGLQLNSIIEGNLSLLVSSRKPPKMY